MLMEIAKITASPEVQPRVALQYQTVESYCEAIRRGDELPPVRVFFDGKTNWLTRGFHRLEAYKLHGSPRIPVDLREGTFQDAILDATESNGDHGLARSPEDLARSIEMTWKVTRERGEKWTQEQIAKHCHCSQQRVSQVLGNTRASNSPARSEKRAAVERALVESPDAPAREVARNLEAKGVRVDHKTVQAVREEKARCAAKREDTGESSAPDPKIDPPSKRSSAYSSRSVADTAKIITDALRVARGAFGDADWNRLVGDVEKIIGVREYGARE